MDRQAILALYDLLEGRDVPDESAFVDAVNSNLSKGRMLILVVGDGITEQASRLGSLLQTQLASRFTFAMVELPVFNLPNDQGQLVLPRTQSKTETVERGGWYTLTTPDLSSLHPWQNRSAGRKV